MPPRLILSIVVQAILAATRPDYQQARRIPDLQARREALALVLEEAGRRGDRSLEASVLLDSAAAANSLGKYKEAGNEAGEAVARFRRLNHPRNLARALNTQGNARLYQGDYAGALTLYRESLAVSRQAGDTEQAVYRLNNIGGVHFFQAQYGEAWLSFSEARRLVDSNAGAKWHAAALQKSAVNQAALLQRIGRDREALTIYRDLLDRNLPGPAADHAQLLSNLGVIYRRLGDPVKAIELYRQALAGFEKAQHSDGRLGVLKNIAIVQALDLDDLVSARTTLEELSRQAAGANTRERLQARLYLAEAEYLQGRFAAAGSHWRDVLTESRTLKATEEEWKALYGLGRLALKDRDQAGGIRFLRESIRLIDRVRLLTTTAQRRDLLADKRDVFDTLLAALSSPDHFSEWLRVRGWAAQRHQRDQALAEASSDVPVETDEAVLYYWIGREQGAVAWITRRSRGLTRFEFPEAARRQQSRFLAQVSQDGENGWKEGSLLLGQLLLGGIPPLSDPTIRRLTIVPDTQIATLPFDALTLPGTDSLVVDRFETAFLPMLQMKRFGGEAARLQAWSRTALVVSDVPFSNVRGLPGDERLPPLPFSRGEGALVLARTGGRTRELSGLAARKSLFVREAGKFPILHLATHAVTDEADPSRSRLLFSDEPLYLNEIRDLALPDTRLVVLSACSTSQGAEIWGVGLESLSMAFLRSGARSVIGTLWPMEDRAAARMMPDFYGALGRGEPVGRAIHWAKQRLRQRGHPAGWAGFVLYGDPRQPVPAAPSPLPYLGGAGAASAGIALLLRYRKRRSG